MAGSADVCVRCLQAVSLGRGVVWLEEVGWRQAIVGGISARVHGMCTERMCCTKLGPCVEGSGCERALGESGSMGRMVGGCRGSCVMFVEGTDSRLMCVKPIGLKPGAASGMTVPCGQCIECRLKRSREWALRCVHEASLYDVNSFVTLTYEDKFLPAGGSLDRAAFPLFMKRLRKARGPVRYFHAGEYGEKSGRPHYHALLFGLQFGDLVEYGRTGSGCVQFISDDLSALWPYGMASIGSVTFESAQYVAKYCVKKVTGPAAVGYYQGRVPEYATMSRRPGIGAGWLEKFHPEVMRDDSCIVRGHEVQPPRYYDKKLEELDAARVEVMKARRDRKRIARGVVGWRERAARELIAVAKLKLAEAR